MTPGIELATPPDVRAALGESPFWDAAESVLWWTDIEGGLIHRFTPATGEDVTFAFGGKTAFAVPRQAGGLLVGTEDGLYGFDPATGERTVLARPEADRPDNRMNDATLDPRGCLWCGSTRRLKPPGPVGAIHRFDTDHSSSLWFDGLVTSNGLAFSPDGRTMYLSDSFHEVRTIWRCPYDPDTGRPGEREVFFDTRAVRGRPDGGAVDADGCYWMAGVSGWELVRLTPEGRVDMRIDMPVERPSKPAFGGARLDTLFVTSIAIELTPGSEPDQPLAGGLFALTGLPVGGFPMASFAG